MTHEEICASLNKCRPGAAWSLSGNTYDGLTWLDSIQGKPTWEEIQTVSLSLEQ